MNLHFAEVASGTLLAILVAVQGVNSIVVGAGNRPLIRGLGPLAAGLECLPAPALFSPAGRRATTPPWALGRSCLYAGGWSTIWLSWTTRREDPSPSLLLVPSTA